MFSKKAAESDEKKKSKLFSKIIVAKKKVEILRSKMNFHVITYNPISLNYGRVKLISLQIGFTGSFLSYKATQFLFLPLKSRSTLSDLLAVVTSILTREPI